MASKDDLVSHPGNPDNLPVPVAPQGGPVNVYDPTAGGAVFWTSLDRAIAAHRVKIGSAMNGQSSPIEDHLGELVKCDHVLVHGGKVVAADGEEIAATRIVFLCHGDLQIATWSDNVLTCLKRICQIEGRPPWNPPLVLQFHENISNRKMRFFSVITREDVTDATFETKQQSPKKGK